MDRVVLDASAILAVIMSEPAAEKLTPLLLARSVASTVNLAEVHTKLVSRGWSPAQAWEDSTSPVAEILPFSEDHARLTGDLMAHTRNLGLSLGDRACLGLAIQLKLSVYTADKAWKNLNLNLKVHILR